MDILSWVLVAVVGFNVVALIYRTGVPLLKYETAKGRAVRQKGKIISSYGEFRFYNYRSQYSDQCRGTFTCQSVLEKFYPLGRRYGNSGLYPCFYSK